MKQKELEEILEKHKKWLLNEDGGERANLEGENLSYTNLYGVDLQDANLANTDLQNAELKGAYLKGANLQGANLKDADLQDAFLSNTDLRNAEFNGANLQGAFLNNADLKGANIDYSSLPLWCGSLHTHFDERQLRQIAYHLVKAWLHSKNASPETKHELAKLIDFANGFHRADECGIITLEEKKS